MNDEAQSPDSLTSMSCPDVEGLSREDLLLYLIGRGAEGERVALESHLRTCDTCVRELAHVQRRLDLAGEVPHSVPPSVREAALRAFAPGLRGSGAKVAAPSRARAPLWPAVRQWIETALDLRVLVPVSVAAGALFMVGFQELWVRPGMEGERMRAVEIERELRVTAAEVLLRARPSAEAESNATLARGTLVRVAGEERGWLWVLLPDGQSGWVERRAFE